MATRQIIQIKEELCDGCGNCITACAEGALQLVDGKAKLVKEMFCDGFGDCIGECPTGALVIQEREAGEFDFEATRKHVAQTGGVEAVQRFDDAARAHERKHAPAPVVPDLSMHAHGGGGCPGSRAHMPAAGETPRPVEMSGNGGPRQAIPSELRQWPIQIHLVQPGMPFFRDKELVVMNTCGPLASADVHWRFLRGRSVVIGCPKLDNTAPYAAKLAAILREPSIPKVTVVRMEVPCCGGLTSIVQEAVAGTGRGDLVLEEVTLGVDGGMDRTQRLA